MTEHSSWTGPVMDRREFVRALAASGVVVTAMGTMLGTGVPLGPTEAMADEVGDMPDRVVVVGQSGAYAQAGVVSQANDGSPYMSAMAIDGTNRPVYCLATHGNHSSPRPNEHITFVKQSGKASSHNKGDDTVDAAVCGYLLSYGYPAMSTVQGVTGQQARYVTQAALWMSDYTRNPYPGGPTYWDDRGLETRAASDTTHNLGLTDKARAFLNQAKAAVAAGWKGGIVLYTGATTPDGTHSGTEWQEMVLGYIHPPKGKGKLQKSTSKSW